MKDLRGVISIRGLRCRGHQGTTPEEQRLEREYLVDVAVTADIADAVATDDLSSAIDIAALAAFVREEVGRRPRALVERLTADVAQAILGRFPQTSSVQVKVEKQRPEGLDAAGEAVELVLTRGARLT